MAWRLAKSLEQLRKQVNAKWPARSKQSDGTIGNAEHSSRSSDHNPWVDGSVVTAIDITHDPKSGCDSYALAAALVASRDPRIKYIISNGKICSGSAQSTPAWIWRKYTGANKHDHHVHVSVKASKAQYDNMDPWSFDLGKVVLAPSKPYVPPPPTLRKGDTGTHVELLQERLNADGASLKVDGGFGLITERAVRAFQTEKKLVIDGIVGPQVWAAFK